MASLLDLVRRARERQIESDPRPAAELTDEELDAIAAASRFKGAGGAHRPGEQLTDEELEAIAGVVVDGGRVFDAPKAPAPPDPMMERLAAAFASGPVHVGPAPAPKPAPIAQAPARPVAPPASRLEWPPDWPRTR